MYVMLFQLFIGIILLVVFTKILVQLGRKMAAAIRISPLIIGITVVAFGTSLPELVVSLIALIKQDAGLAIGNIIGSNIINILLVFPLGIFIGKLCLGTAKTQKSAILLLIITIFFMLVHFLPIPSLFIGAVFLILAILVTLIEYQWGEYGSTHEDVSRLRMIKREKFTYGEVGRLIGSIGGIIAGGILVVVAVEKIALLTGYSTTILGLSLTAFATSLPEMLTTIFSQEENQEKITIGNIIGSNLYNLLLIGGVVTLFSSKSVQLREWLMLIFSTLCFVLILRHYSGQKIPKWISGILLLFFVIYLYLLNSSRFIYN